MNKNHDPKNGKFTSGGGGGRIGVRTGNGKAAVKSGPTLGAKTGNGGAPSKAVMKAVAKQQAAAKAAERVKALTRQDAGRPVFPGAVRFNVNPKTGPTAAQRAEAAREMFGGPFKKR